MDAKSGAFRAFWNMASCASLRAVLGGLAAAAAAGLFFLAGGAVLGWSKGMSLEFAGLCSLRGAFAGLVAGTIMGALSGVYHVEEPGPVAEKVESCNPEPANCNPAPVRLSQAGLRNGKIHSRLG